MKPLVGISSRLRPVTGSTGEQPTHTVARFYTDAVAAAGAFPVLLPPQAPEETEPLLDRLDGLLLTGGGDVAARLYGLEHHRTMYEVDDERDAFEMALVREAARRRVPLLAICRGIQVVNVALGGTLIRDIPSDVPGHLDHYVGGESLFRGHQRVRLEPGSRLAQLLGTAEVLVNSMHHQAVDRLGKGLRPVGWSDDGVVEALEPEDDDWALWAVQWHPETLAPADPLARRLFEALAAAAAKAAP